jgi:hypothetical protein
LILVLEEPECAGDDHDDRNRAEQPPQRRRNRR